MSETIISVIGLGYVGLQVAVAFSKLNKTIGYDINLNRINSLKKYRDKNNEISSNVLKKSKIKFTSQKQDLKEANFYIITVPTPIPRPSIKVKER